MVLKSKAEQLISTHATFNFLYDNSHILPKLPPHTSCGGEELKKEKKKGTKEKDNWVPSEWGLELLMISGMHLRAPGLWFGSCESGEWILEINFYLVLWFLLILATQAIWHGLLKFLKAQAKQCHLAYEF